MLFLLSLLPICKALTTPASYNDAIDPNTQLKYLCRTVGQSPVMQNL